MFSKKIGDYFVSVFHGTAIINSPQTTLKNLSLWSGGNNFHAALVPAKEVASLNQIWFAAEKAIETFSRGSSISPTLKTEFILRVVGERQVKNALKKASLKKGKNTLFFVVFSKKGKPVLSELMKLKEKPFRPNIKLADPLIERNALMELGGRK